MQMIVYQSDKAKFIADVNSFRIEETIHDQFQEKIGHKVSANEARSWGNSLRFMRDILIDNEIPSNCGVAIEFQIPSTSRRVDFILSGLDQDKKDTLIIVELKQWSKAEKTNKDAIVKTYVGGGNREVTHPSYQAWSYSALINDFNEYVYTGDTTLHPCAYLHNYKESKPDPLRDEFYGEHLKQAPIFFNKEELELRRFIKQHVKYGDNAETIYHVENSRIKPSKGLANSLVSLLKGNKEFVMIADQKVVYETVLQCAIGKDKTVIIVDGGPGTGKSVVAINLLVELISRGKNTQYVTRNAAPREVYEAKLKGGDFKKSHITNLFKGSGTYTEALPNLFDTLIVDEAHRLNDKSGMFRNMGENQIKEIINAAKCSVFFLDEDQQVHIHDIGDKNEIEKWANHHNANIIHLSLTSQFRCNGSDGYIAWLDNILQIRETANFSVSELGYDFQILSDPLELKKLIIEKNKESNKARMLAGYCWDWISKKDPDAFDIEFPEYKFHMKWNLADDGMLWMIKEDSVNEVGCIHTSQGLELDYIGVIIGSDMTYRNGEICTEATERSKNDRTVFGYKKMYKENAEIAEELGDKIIKNTYRTLMTRGMKGCYVYCVDKALEDYLKEKLCL